MSVLLLVNIELSLIVIILCIYNTKISLNWKSALNHQDRNSNVETLDLGHGLYNEGGFKYQSRTLHVEQSKNNSAGFE